MSRKNNHWINGITKNGLGQKLTPPPMADEVKPRKG